MNSSRVSCPGSGGAPTSIPSIVRNHKSSLTHWCTICSRTLRPRRSSARGRTGKSSSRNSLHTLTTFTRSVSYVSTRKSYRMGKLLRIYLLSRPSVRQSSPPRFFRAKKRAGNLCLPYHHFAYFFALRLFLCSQRPSVYLLQLRLTIFRFVTVKWPCSFGLSCVFSLAFSLASCIFSWSTVPVTRTV